MDINMQNTRILKIKELRNRTQASYADCKKALNEGSFDLNQAEKILMEKGLREIDTPPTDSDIGVIHSYVHPGSRIGVLVEVGCETDFVAKTKEFQRFVKEMALQVASMKPQFVSRADIGEEFVDIERERRIARLEKEGNPGHLLEELADAEMVQWYAEVCLLEQTYVRDNSKIVKELLAELVNKTGEACRISRFSRWEIGVDNGQAIIQVEASDFDRMKTFLLPSVLILLVMLFFLLETLFFLFR
jgi:elongation factor Ts